MAQNNSTYLMEEHGV